MRCNRALATSLCRRPSSLRWPSAKANGGAEGATSGVDLAQLTILLTTLQAVGIDTTLLEQQGITESLSLAALDITPDTLLAVGINTTTVALDAGRILPSSIQTTTAQLLGALKLNTLAAFGLQLRQGDVDLNQLGADKLNAQVGDVLEIFVGPIPILVRVKAIVAEAGPVGVLMPVVIKCWHLPPPPWNSWRPSCADRRCARRQQVGMLRAIGYHAGMVAFSFVLEASFIALTGILHLANVAT